MVLLFLNIHQMVENSGFDGPGTQFINCQSALNVKMPISFRYYSSPTANYPHPTCKDVVPIYISSFSV